MKPVPYICGCLSWSSVIGNFITNFGMLDLHVQDFLESLLSEEQFSKLKERPFFDRVECIKQHLAEADCAVTNRSGFEQFFQRLDPLRQTRNHIAHGVLRMGGGTDDKSCIVTLSLPKELGGAEARHFEFAELQAELSTLNGLIEEFQQLAGFKTSVTVIGQVIFEQ